MIDHVTPVDNQSLLLVTFDRHVKVSTIVKEHFKLYTDEATPALIANPFKTIVICDDYDSITRTLKLKLNVALTAHTGYTLVTTGMQNAAGASIPDDSEDFITDFDLFPITEPIPQPVFIEDHSIVDSTVVDYTGGSSGGSVGGSADFNVTETDPVSGDYFIEPDHENGRLTIVFSTRPDVAFLNSTYIKVQRKKNQIAPIRWETIPVVISIESGEPFVYLDFPAIDDADTYNEPDHTYFEEGYVYRVKLSRFIQSN